MVQLRNDGEVKWKQLDYMGDIGSSTDDGSFTPITTGSEMLTFGSTIQRSSCCFGVILLYSSHD